MPVGHVAPALALLVGAAVSLVAASFLARSRQHRVALISLISLAAATALTAVLHLTVPAELTLSGSWALDGVTAWASGAMFGAAALVIALCPRWLATDPRHGEFYALLLLSTLGAVMMAAAADTMELMVGMLLVSVTGYPLAGYHRGSRMAAEASVKYFLLGALTSPLLFLGIVLLYGVAGTTRYGAIAGRLAAGGADPVALTAAVALILLGVSFELGAVPVHPWVPDVAQGSPVPAAGFLTVVPKMGALVAIARLSRLFPDPVGWRFLIAVVATATMTVGNLAALWQSDVRRLLGWSSVSQAGYGLLAVVALGRSRLAVPSLVLFLVGYGLANVAAFSAVADLRGRTRRDHYAGLARARPWHATVLVVALLSLTGIPPLIGFSAKLTLFGAAIAAGYGWLAAVAVANTVLSLFYYLRVIAPMFLEPPRGEVALLGGGATVAMITAGLLVVAAGLAAQPILWSAAGASLLPR